VALRGAAEACRRHGTAERVDVVWQYILFRWNDSDAELDEARRLAKEIGVRIKWVVTHTAGASRRFPADDPSALARLEASDPWRLLSCNQRQENLLEGGSWNLRYRAAVTPDRARLEARPGDRFALRLRIENRSAASWNGAGVARPRLGVRLRTPTGRILRELPSLPVPDAALPAGGAATALYDGFAPADPGPYELFFDLVDDGLAWFHERGSRPAVCRLQVGGDARRWEGGALAVSALAAVNGCAPDESATDWARHHVESGQPIEALLADIVAGLPPAERALRLAAGRDAAARALGLTGG
jgi:hypothetical protein